MSVTTKPRQAGPAKLFNEFLTRAVKSGDLRVEHRRVRSRQPDNEVFARKALVSMQHLAPEVEPQLSVTELTVGHRQHGVAGAADAAALHLRMSPDLVRYVGEPSGAVIPPSSAQRPLADVFSALHAYAFIEVSNELSAVPTFGACAASIAASLSGQAGRIRQRVRDAADSVFAQSFADVHAISLMAAFDGTKVALEALGEVLRRRDAAGDFGSFSLAPLSCDTSAALHLLRFELERGKDFAIMSRDELWGHSLFLAGEGLGAWMQTHGVDALVAAGVVQAAEAAGEIVAMASATPAAAARAAFRVS